METAPYRPTLICVKRANLPLAMLAFCGHLWVLGMADVMTHARARPDRRIEIILSLR
jgi:hypothetical protein